jgi:transposase-like protein
VLKDTMDALSWLREQPVEADPDLQAEMVKVFTAELMSEDADAQCGAAYGERSEERVNRRNGYRTRSWDTRADTIDLAIPKLREGSYFPDRLLDRRRRAESAFVSVVAECDVRGVSTHRVEGLVRPLGIASISRSGSPRWQPSSMSRWRPSATARSMPVPTPYVWMDALTFRVRKGGRPVQVAGVVATGVNARATGRSWGLI